jgi:hypothetical protein
MAAGRIFQTGARTLAAAFAVAAASYTAYAGLTWIAYGKPGKASSSDVDELLDRFMPAYEVADRHSVRVAAPAAVTYSAAKRTNLDDSPLVRGIFKAREFLMRSKPAAGLRRHGIVAETQSLGWGVLAEVPDRQIVMGAITRPWEANPTFQALPSAEFANFRQPGYVKIVWTLRADPTGDDASVFRTETRAVATDEPARSKFRRYWALLSPGIIIIRWAMLPLVKSEAERRAGAAA